MHDNFVIGIYDPKMAHFIEEDAPFSQTHLKTIINGQPIEFWLLPDINNHALDHLISLLRSAQKSIYLAIFTFTHPTLADELIKAKTRGVDVTVIVDGGSANGASSKVIKMLKKGHVRVCTNRGPELFHHKLLYVDKKILVNGSANWTKSAFEKNLDCFLILHNLNQDQINFLDKFFKNAKKGSEEI
jgi:cardiolipin synthase A/B